MSLRTTRQYVEVLETGDGPLRVTRQYVEVLSNLPPTLLYGLAEDHIVLGSTVLVRMRLDPFIVEDTLSLSDHAEGGLVKTCSASNAISLSDESYTIFTTDNTLTLSDSVDLQFVAGGSGTSVLAITDAVGLSMAYCRTVTDAIQTVTPTYDDDLEEIVDVITGLQDSASAARTVYAPFDNRHAIQLTTQVLVVRVKAGAIDCAASNEIELDDSTVKNQVGVALSGIHCYQSVSVDVCTPLESFLVLGSFVSAIVECGRTASTAVELSQTVAYSIASSGVLGQYHPFVGSAVTGSTPPPLTLSGPMAGITAPFQLVYPASGVATDSVTLRAPEFGNKDRLSFNRVLRETRGGTLVVFADPMWPKIQTLVLNFVGLRQNEAQDLLDFFDDYLGLEIGLIDWEQRYWKGVITTPDSPVIEDSFNSFSASFEFEGELDPTWSPQVIPVVPGTPLRRIRPELSEYVAPLEPVPVPILPYIYSSATADATLAKGLVVYTKSNGHIVAASSDADATTGAAGLLWAGVTSGETAYFLTEGSITMADWTLVAGTVALSAGEDYYLTTAGQISLTAPIIGSIVRVGRAIAANTIDIEISRPIKL